MWKVLSTVELSEVPKKKLSEVASIRENPYHKMGHKHLTKEELLNLVKDVDALILGGEKIDRDLIDAAEKLRIIARTGVGYENVDLESAAEKGIAVTYTPCKTLAVSVAEHAIAFMFSLAKLLPQNDKYVRTGDWSAPREKGVPHPRGQILRGKVLGVVGLGRIGSEVARLACGIGMSVIYYSRHRHEDVERETGARYVTLEELFRQSDFISISVALTEKTRGMIGRKELSLMKKSAYLINMSRGAVVDQRALYEALRIGSIAGAGFDVFDPEPVPKDDPLLKLDNVILSPHTGGSTAEVEHEMGLMAVEDVIRALRGEKPLHPIPF